LIQLTDLKICENCGNTFAKIIQGEPVNRCPACKVWKKQVVDQALWKNKQSLHKIKKNSKTKPENLMKKEYVETLEKLKKDIQEKENLNLSYEILQVDLVK